MRSLSPGIDYVDLSFQGVPNVMATAVFHGSWGIALVDPGPSTALPVLEAALARRGMALADVRALLLTHIHLDHAGATGTLVRRHPGSVVYVHERGAPHLRDPSKLIQSAGRLYGDRRAALWGEIAPVPEGRLHALRGGERLAIGDRELDVAYTPGHASHHVSYFDRRSRIAFAGDTAGIRIGSARFVMPPTPPPDIDLGLWRESIDRLQAWRPETLFLTHFGPHAGPAAHLAALKERLDEIAGLAKTSLERGQDRGQDDEARVRWFTGEMRRLLRRHLSEADAAVYDRASSIELNWLGLARYWRKRAGA